MTPDELAAELAKAASTIETRAGAKVDETANKVRDTAKTLVPVLTGETRESIEATREGTAVEVGPTTRQGFFMEHGTYKDAPQPFMGPALEAHQAELEDGLTDVAADI